MCVLAKQLARHLHTNRPSSSRKHRLMSYNLLPLYSSDCPGSGSLSPFRRSAERDSVFWLVWAVAVAGTALWVFVRQSAGWGTGLSTALWLTIFTCLLLYGCVCLLNEDAWRLSPLLLPYLLILGLMATIWSQVPEKSLVGEAPLAWIGTHIFVSLATYGLVTLAAVAALAAAIQHRALRSKKRNRLSSILPAVSSSERLLVQLLATSEIVLAVGLLPAWRHFISNQARSWRSTINRYWRSQYFLFWQYYYCCILNLAFGERPQHSSFCWPISC